MPWSETLCQWVIHSAIVSLLVLAAGSTAVLLCREPARRVWMIELTLAGCLIAPWLGMIPGYPRLSVPWQWASVSDPPLPAPPASRAPVDGPVGLPSEEWVESPHVVSLAPAAKAANAPWRSFDVALCIIVVYGLGVALGLGWWLVGLLGLARIIRTTRPSPPRCRELLAEVSGQRAAGVTLLVSRRVRQPFAFALGRPVIVLPDDMCGDEQALRWSLAHEWTHLERHDLPAWMMAGLVQVFFFYHPLVWWLREQLRLCQDFVADDQAARQTPHPEDYAEFLAVCAAGASRPAMVGLGMGAGRSELYKRVVMLVQHGPLERRVPGLWSFAVACAAAIFVSTAATLSNSPRSLAQESVPPSVAKGEASLSGVERTTAVASGPWKVQLPDGVAVELLGVGEKSTGWWRPNGTAWDGKAPLPGDWGSSWSVERGQVHRVFLLRIKAPLSPDPSPFGRSESDQKMAVVAPHLAVKGLPGMSAHVDTNSARDVSAKEETIEGKLHGSFPMDATSTNVIIGLTLAWKTVAERDARGTDAGAEAGEAFFLSNPPLPDPVLMGLGAKSDTTLITTAYQANRDKETRIVAIDQEGNHGLAKTIVMRPNATPPTATWVFAMPAARIKRFLVQESPYTWIAFRNASLRSGQKTNVQVVHAQNLNNLQKNSGEPQGHSTAPPERSLQDAVKQFNEAASNDSIGQWEPLLTEEEVIAAIRGWDRKQHKIDDKTYAVYQKIVDTRTLPKGAWLESCTGLGGSQYDFTVWWIDLSVMTGEDTGYTFRIRERKISSKPAPTIPVRGTVVDEGEKPVAGAEVWLRTFSREAVVHHTRSDTLGRFVLEVPSSCMVDSWPWNRTAMLWAHTAGRRVGTGRAALSDNPSEVLIRLGPATDTSFVVLDPEGRPCAGALVEPYYNRTSLKGQFLPDELLARVGARTDAEGRVKLPAVPPDLLPTVRVTTKDFGIQLQHIYAVEAPPTVSKTIRLRPVGRIEGRVIADSPEVASGLRLIFTSHENRDEPPPVPPKDWPTLGFVDIKSDEQGHFITPVIAIGDTEIRATVGAQPLQCPRLPEWIQVQAHQTTMLEIPMVPTVVVRGSVKVQDTGKPIPGVLVEIRYGVRSQETSVVSDSRGQYTARVLPGPIRLQERYGRLDYVRPRGGLLSYAVPENVKQFDLPPVEMVPAQRITGRLVDEQDQPVANVHVFVVEGQQLHGIGKSEPNGQFILTAVPASINPVDAKYRWMPTRGVLAKCEVLQADPLILRAIPK